MKTKAPFRAPETADTPEAEATAVPRPESAAELAPSFHEQPTTAQETDVPPESAAAPQRCGRYEILQEIAVGGMGVVYRARDTELGRLVALKMIRPGVFAGREMIERFHREAQAAARLHHRHIVSIYDTGWHGGQPFFTMELVCDGSLAQHLGRVGADPRKAVAFVAKVARAIHYAHEHDILHRDLKPANVLLDEHGEPLVSDFGLAKLLDSDMELTQPDQQLGTPAYMAPEQFPGSARAATRATDVWALGVLLFQLLTGQRPFTGKNRDELARQVRSVAPVRPRLLRPKLDAALETLTLRCLEKEPARRFATAEELADELERWLRGEPIRSRPESWFRRARRRLRRHPVLCAAAVCVGVALAAVPVYQHVTDPDRPLRQIEQRLARGQEVPLIPEGGRPVWSSFPLVEGGIRGTVEGGPFLLQAGPDLCVLELVRDPQCDSFRLSADIEHRQGEQLSEVGIYFGRHSLPQHNETQAFCLFGFNDKRAWVQHNATKFTSQAALYQAGAIGPEISPYSAPIRWEYFDPFAELHADQRNGVRFTRRRLQVDVTPKGVECFWEGKSLGLASWPELQKNSRSMLESLPHGAGADLQPIAIRDVIHGGLGVFVRTGSAAFWRVELRPLNEAVVR